MALTTEQLRRYRRRFAWLFLISAVVLSLSAAYLWFVAPPPQTGYPSSSGGILPEPASITLPVLVSVASLLASLVSLVGFFITTTLALRKDEREQQQAALDLEQKRLEIEKLRQELEHRNTPDVGA